MLLLKVCTQEARTLEEEYDHLRKLLASGGNFFSWEVHPNVVRANNFRSTKLRKKMAQVMEEMIELGYY